MRAVVAPLLWLWLLLASSLAQAADITVYPAIGLTVYAEDGVTQIPSTGAIVTDAKYYQDLLRQGMLLTTDPLGLSGDAVTIAPVTRVSASLTSALTSQLSTRPCLIDGEQLSTSGFSTAIDGGGASWRCAMGTFGGADGYTKIATTNGQWQMVLNYGQSVNIRQLGCVPDGSTTCSSKVNTFLATWLSTYGAGADLTIDVPAFARSTTGGYRLESPGIQVPGQMSLSFISNGRPYVDGLLYNLSTATATRSGAVFVADVGVTAFSKLNRTDGTVPTIHFRNIAIMGPGGSFTSGHGIDCQTGLVVTANGLRIAGFNIGYYARSVVSVHGVYDLKATGCLEGVHIGETGSDQEFVDGEFYGYDGEFNEAALVLEIARDVRFYGGLIQSNYHGVVVGTPAGTHSMRAVHLGFNHYEVNGDDAGPGPLPWPAGGKHVVFYSGGTIDTLQFVGSTAGGVLMPATLPRDITIPAGANVRFDHTFMSGALNVTAGAFVELLSGARDAGFTSYSIPANSTVNWLSSVQSGGGTLSGSYTHDWALSGPVVRKQLNGALNVLNVINIPNGQRVTFVFIQDATASRAVTWAGPFRMNAWNNTGFGVAGSFTTTTFVNTDGALVQCDPQPTSGWLP